MNNKGAIYYWMPASTGPRKHLDLDAAGFPDVDALCFTFASTRRCRYVDDRAVQAERDDAIVAQRQTCR